MNLNKLTTKTQEVLQQAQTIALANGQQSIEPAHILKGMLEIDEAVLPFIFNESNLDSQKVSNTLTSIVNSYPKVSGGQPFMSKDSNQLFATSFKLMDEFQDEYLSLDVIFLGLSKGKDSVSQMLKDLGLTSEAIKAAIMKLRNGDKVESQGQEDTYRALDKYANNLNEMAKTGKLEPVIGRDEEIR